VPISTFSELKTAVEEWLAHDDVSGRTEDLIALAEAGLNRRLSVRQMRQVLTGTLTTSTITIPDDWLEMIRFTVSSGVPLISLEYQAPNAFFAANHQTVSGFPKYYTIVGSTIHVGPTPDSTSSYSYTIEYLERLPVLSDSNPENWLLTIAPDLYLFASLLQAEPYLHNDERLPVWQTMVNNAIHELQGQDMRSRYRPGARQLPGGSGAIESNFRRF
jgi:hypothetical protein